jgi:hypothetical protein
MTTQTISSQINASRDATRATISDYVQEYLELQGVDLTKSSFLSYIIDIVSTLTGNLMFYQMSTYREFFLTQAQLPESILNLAAFLGYSPQEATYSTANAFMTIPLTFMDASTIFTIPSGFIFYADNIQFITDYSTVITLTNNYPTTIKVTTLAPNINEYSLPWTTGDGNLYFVLPVKQYKNVQQEFQISTSIQPYQFITINVPIDGKVADIDVEIKTPGSGGYITYTEFSSLYLMDATDKGYILRRTENGIKLYFGNGLMGVQPDPGSTLRVTAKVTLGANGNIIAGSLTKGQRIYNVTFSGITQIVNYTVTNTQAATGGTDEESYDTTRINAINYITSLNRLVSEGDYANCDVVMPTSPLIKTKAVLKRSDVKVNDIQLYTALFYGTDPEETTKELLVPTRDIFHEFSLATTDVPRETVLTFEGDDYYTIFDMTINKTDSAAYYTYIARILNIVPTMIISYTSGYDIYADNLIVQRSGNNANLQLLYHQNESTFALATCDVQIESTGVTYSMINDATSEFTYTYIPYAQIPEGEQTLYFTIYDNVGNPVVKYETKFTFRQNLDDFMMSSVLSDSTSTTVYDIPVINKDYYDSINKTTFESVILQNLLQNTNFVGHRMLTDFVNVKFVNGTGPLRNMQLNEVTKAAVIDIVDTLPLTPSLNDRYALGPGFPQPTHVLNPYPGDLVTCTDTTNVTWIHITPRTDDIIYITNKAAKYIYSWQGWIPIPSYSIPLELEIEVFRNTSTITIDDLRQNIQDALMLAFESRFASDIAIYQSEIIDVIQEVTGVKYCRLIKPETSIFFNFDLDKLTQKQLLEYAPEYVYFRKGNIALTPSTAGITIRVVG